MVRPLPEATSPPHRSRNAAWAALVAGLVALIVYAATAARTITWWEGSSYPLAAVTLGIDGAPGSLLLTLIGWTVTRIPVAHPIAFQLNLVAALIAAFTAALVAGLAARLAARDEAVGRAEVAAGALAGCVFALGPSMWTNAVRFAPYGLSALFTALLLATAMSWWRRAGDRDATAWLFLLALLVGSDLSVHRTNLLLAPGLLAWVALRRPGVLARPRPWIASLAGLALGLAFHLLLIPLSRRDPPFDIGEPRDLARWWDYVSLNMHGGGFLVNLFPRRADLFRVQLADYAHYLRLGLAPGGPGAALGLASALLLAIGLLVMLRRDPRRTAGLLALYLCASLGAVLYFNLPAHYFRVMDRHYIPSFVLLAPFLAAGAAALLRRAAALPGAAGRVAMPVLLVALALLPFALGRAGLATCDFSRMRFAETYTRDVLEPLAPHAILLTNGDNDSFPPWYLQQAERVRRDVTVINVPLLNTDWYLAQLGRRDPDLRLLASRCRVDEGVRDSVVVLPVASDADAGLPAGSPIPTSVVLRPGNTHLDFSGEHAAGLLQHDRAAIELLRLVRWRRPLYLALTIGPGVLDWLRPCARLEGMAYRLVPSTNPEAWDLARARTALLSRVRYAGMADRSMPVPYDSRPMLSNYVAALGSLAEGQLRRGDAAGCLETLRFMRTRVPPDRVGMDPRMFADLQRKAAGRSLR
ncbi:MAG TPA: DUF2723 domain-containing protein [Terriglobales bacterium]|nr:DUF2723 domain-containing protein [Terriglobales bacterium]